MELEVIIPLRNPPDALRKTVQSMVRQTDCDFRVLISDNYSSKGTELIAEAVAELRRAGIAVQLLKPPMELGRVEHWNWLHHTARAQWVKPLFAGDWLEPGYVATLRGVTAAHPECRHVICGYTYHRPDHEPLPVLPSWTEFRAAGPMRTFVLFAGMQFGPPSAGAYQRDAFIAAGGYCTALPICADSLLFCSMAAMFGTFAVPELLAHFNIHQARFSTTLSGRRRDTMIESFTYYWMLGYHAWTDNFRFGKIRFARLFGRELRHYWFRR